MVTAKGAEVDRVVGFELGADDYVRQNRSACASCCCASRQCCAGRRTARPRPRPRRSPSAGCTSIARRHRAGRRPGGELDGARAAPAVHAVRTAQPRAIPRRAARRRLVGQRRERDPHRRHPRQTPARESWGRSGLTSRPSAGSATASSAPHPSSRREGSGFRTKLFAVSLSLIVLSVLAGEIYLRQKVEANLVERCARISRSGLDLIHDAHRPDGAGRRRGARSPPRRRDRWNDLATGWAPRSRAPDLHPSRRGRAGRHPEVDRAALDDMENHHDRPEVLAALGGRPGSSMRWSATLGRRMMYVAIPVERDGHPILVAAGWPCP